MSDDQVAGDVSIQHNDFNRKEHEDCGDEVKVFRKEEEEEDTIGSSQVEHEDKQDVAFEAEMDLPNPYASTGIPNITQGLQNIIMNSPYSSPFYPSMYPAAQLMLSPQYHMLMYQKMMQHQQQQVSLLHQMPSMMSNPSTPKSNPGPMRTPKALKENRNAETGEKKPHIKKPLNAYMIFMKDTRAKLQQKEGNATKQSAELNAEMGKMWQELSREEQQVYFNKATELKEEHERLYPGWSARDNYACNKRKKMQKRQDRSNNENIEMKKCRARFGVDFKDKWCRHCMRKKRCLNVYDDHEQHSSSSSEGSPTPVRSNADTPNSHHLTPLNHSTPQNINYDAAAHRAQALFQNSMAMQQPFGMASPFFGVSPFAGFPFGFQQQPLPQQSAPIVHPSSLLTPKPELPDVSRVKSE